LEDDLNTMWNFLARLVVYAIAAIIVIFVVVADAACTIPFGGGRSTRRVVVWRDAGEMSFRI